jgi:putative transposase
VIRVEDLNITAMTRSARGTAESPGKNVRAKAGLNDGIRKSGWGLLVRRLEDKAPGRVEKVPPAYTSQCCSACGHVARENTREPDARKRASPVRPGGRRKRTHLVGTSSAAYRNTARAVIGAAT